MSQLRYVFGSLGALYSSYGATSYCQFHSLFLAYGAICITASPTAFTAVAKELIAIRDYYFDFNSFKSGGTSFTRTSFVGWPAAASQAAHGLAIYYLAAGNYTIGLTRSSTSETTYDPINVYAVSAPGADQD